MLITLAALSVTPSSAWAGSQAPSLPHYFHGTVKIDGVDAPAGTTLEARGSGVLTGPFNPIVTTQAGRYGDADPSANVPRLLVQGDIAEGASIAFFVNGAQASETATWHSGQITVLDLTVSTGAGLWAELSLVPALDASGYAVVRAGIDGGKDATGQSQTISDGIGAYDAYMTYEAAGVTVTSVSGIAPFSSPTVELNALSGTRTDFGQASSAAVPPLGVANLRLRLQESKDSDYVVTLNYGTITRGNGTAISQAGPATLSFRRGDARADGEVSITDALFIAQYLAGKRGLGNDTTTVNPVNAASVSHNDATGDKITIVDAMFIAQMLAGLRDASFNRLF